MLKTRLSLELVRMTVFPLLGSLPHGSPKNISKLNSCDTELKEDTLALLGNLQNLQILIFLNNTYYGGKKAVPTNSFPCLQLL